MDRSSDHVHREAVVPIEARTKGGRGNTEPPTPQASTASLAHQALSETASLVRTEMALALADLKQEMSQVQHVAIGFGVAAVAVTVFVACAAFALILALGATPWAALGVAAGFLAVAALSGFYGYRQLPLSVLERTRKRLQGDLQDLKEHIA